MGTPAARGEADLREEQGLALWVAHESTRSLVWWRSSLRRERFTHTWSSRCFWHVAVAGIAGGCAVPLPAQKSSAVVLGDLWSPVPEQPGTVLLHGRNQTGFWWGSAANVGRAVSHPGCCCCFPGNPPALPKVTLNPGGGSRKLWEKPPLPELFG